MLLKINDINAFGSIDSILKFLGDGFIKWCVKKYNCDVLNEAVIEEYLDTLPEVYSFYFNSNNEQFILIEYDEIKQKGH